MAVSEQLLKVFCANCGFTVLHGANFCVQCGEDEFLSAYKCTQWTFNYFFPGKFSNYVHGGTGVSCLPIYLFFFYSARCWTLREFIRF